MLADKSGNKQCSTCRATKKTTAFNKNRVAKDGFDNICRMCRKAGRLRWAKPVQTKARLANVTAWRKANPDKVRQYNETWARNNPEKARAHNLRSRAAIMNRKAGDVLTVTELDILASYLDAISADACAYCEAAQGNKNVHDVPVYLGGTPHWHNIRRACDPCALGKRQLTGDEWRLVLGYRRRKAA